MATEVITGIRADNRKLRRDLGKTKSMFRKTFGGIGRGIKGALSTGLGGLGVGAGALGIASIGKEVLDFETSLVRLGIQGGKTDSEMNSLRDSMVGLSKATGLSRGEIADGATELVNRLGAIDPQVLDRLAVASQATGTNMKDLSAVAFKLNTALGIKSAEDLNLALGAMTIAGKTTSIPLSELADVLQSTAPIFTKTGASGVQAAADMTALLQVAQKFGSFKGAAEVGTGFTSFFGKLEKNAGRLKSAGVELFVTKDGITRMKSMEEIFDAIGSSKLARDPRLLTKALGSKEASAFADAILKGREEMESLREVTGEAATVLDNDLAKFLNSDAGKIDRKFNDMKESIANALTPERISNFADVMEKVADALGVVLDHSTGLIAAFAAFKIGGVAVQFTSMAASMKSAAKSGTGLSAQMGKWSTSLTAGLAALSAGVAIGTALDDALGISDAISDLAIDEDADRSGFIQDRIKQFGASGQFQIASRGGDLNDKERRGAQSLFGAAKRSGAIGEGGEVNRLKAFALSKGLDPSSSDTKSAFGFADQGTGSTGIDEAVRAIKFASEQAAKGTIVDIKVSVDPTGKLKAEETDNSKARRSPG